MELTVLTVQDVPGTIMVFVCFLYKLTLLIIFC
jgi:hypothetical protein